jgi:hypothetical protein
MMKRRLVISPSLRWLSLTVGCLALTVSCRNDQSHVGSMPASESNGHSVATPRREIIRQDVLGAQLAVHHETEARSTFGASEPIPASLILSGSLHYEPRRVFAFLVRDEQIVEEQSIAVRAGETREEFDFHFTKTPRASGTYQIKFVEIARSNGTSVLLARLFLSVE